MKWIRYILTLFIVFALSVGSTQQGYSYTSTTNTVERTLACEETSAQDKASCCDMEKQCDSKICTVSYCTLVLKTVPVTTFEFATLAFSTIEKRSFIFKSLPLPLVYYSIWTPPKV
ncbi:MAG: hypothetical protein LBE34_13470 [Flavobacteriaceae bacterium]|jgi:hypothetical protein|nr:hypothetical protein [Flavobacteriaceae bacterium]